MDKKTVVKQQKDYGKKGKKNERDDHTHENKRERKHIELPDL